MGKKITRRVRSIDAATKAVTALVPFRLGWRPPGGKLLCAPASPKLGWPLLSVWFF
jgi:hypothetical protein